MCTPNIFDTEQKMQYLDCITHARTRMHTDRKIFQIVETSRLLSVSIDAYFVLPGVLPCRRPEMLNLLCKFPRNDDSHLTHGTGGAL